VPSARRTRRQYPPPGHARGPHSRPPTNRPSRAPERRPTDDPHARRGPRPAGRRRAAAAEIGTQVIDRQLAGGFGNLTVGPGCAGSRLVETAAPAMSEPMSIRKEAFAVDEEFSATVSAAGRRVIVEGDVDTMSAPQLRTAMKAAAGADGEPLILDLTKVTYLDSRGVAVLYEFLALHQLEILVTAGSAVDTATSISGLTKHVRLHQVDQA